MEILRNIQPPAHPDKLAKDEVKKGYDGYSTFVNWIVGINLVIDTLARPALAGLIVYFTYKNYHHLLDFIEQQSNLKASDRLAEGAISQYIKYSIGLTSVLIITIGYWFLGSGGAVHVLKDAIKSVTERFNFNSK